MIGNDSFGNDSDGLKGQQIFRVNSALDAPGVRVPRLGAPSIVPGPHHGSEQRKRPGVLLSSFID